MRPHNNPHWTRALQRASGVKHRDISPTLAPEIQPVVIVEDLSAMIDPDVQPRFAWGSAGFVSTIGNYAQVSLQNPVASNVAIRVNHLYFSTNLNATLLFHLQLYGGLALASNNALARFSNGFVNGVPAGEIHELIGAGVIGTPTHYLSGNTQLVLPLVVTLQPGQSLLFQQAVAAVAATTLLVAFHWEEREIGQRG